MTADGAALRHSALVYASPEEFLAHTVAFLREGIAAGEGAIVGHTRPGLSLVREALGSDAAFVTFVDVSEAYTTPARTLASYHEIFGEHLQRMPSLRVVGDVQFGPDPGEWGVWAGYEAVFNRSFAHLPAWVWCSYDAERTPDDLLESVWQTHPGVLSHDAWRASDRYEDPDTLLRSVTPEPVRLLDLRSIPVEDGVVELREGLARELVAQDVSEARALDMLVAATEVARNAIEHGGGLKDVRVGRSRERLVCEIVDRGEGFDDPAAGYLAPREGSGAGLWIARQLTWRLEFLRSADGFTARIWL
jgi:anti-sigma regulatory factor (Ser/Thr protein kinase)